MRRVYSERFQRNFRAAPPAVQKACNKQLDFLVRDLHHPSLRAKKYDEARDIWQARINQSWRVFFQIEDDTYYLIDLTAHPK